MQTLRDGGQIFHEGLGRRVNYELTAVPEDAEGQVRAVIGLMTRYAVEDSASPAIELAAQEILASLYTAGPGDREKIQAVFEHVKRRVRFVLDETTSIPFQRERDPLSEPVVEALIRPSDMAVYCREGHCIGDCDDFAMYAAALLVALGVRCGFVTIAADPLDPSRYSHVYVVAYTGEGERIPLDTSHGPYAGWEARSPYMLREWPVSGAGGAWGAGSLVELVVLAALAWLVWRYLFRSQVSESGVER